MRIYTDGHVKDLPALDGMFITSEDPVEAKRLENKHDEYNRQINELLVEIGFDKFTINMYLHAWLNK
ncbi:MAG: hypothetical protein CVV29_07545 [Methanobacteriales archaeon HGW-Methanobacteriales-2]|nr:MAG: hypothetical protein CVV29_07545 [Methanobacteriales archaeon HGW-Methanobacteriales-2]